MTQRQGLKISVVMAILVSLVASLSVYLEIATSNNAPYSAAIPCVAVIAFVTLLILTQPDGAPWQITESSLRSSIAAAIVITYLTVVGIVAFFTGGPNELPAISKTMVTNFNVVVGVVIAFYFGASAYVEARTKSTPQEPGTKVDAKPPS